MMKTLSDIAIRAIDGRPVVAVAIENGEPLALTLRQSFAGRGGAGQPPAFRHVVEQMAFLDVVGPQSEWSETFATAAEADAFVAKWVADHQQAERREAATDEEIAALQASIVHPVAYD